MAYKLELQAELAVVHPVFHVSLFKKCVGDPTSILRLESVAMKDNLSYKVVQIVIFLTIRIDDSGTKKSLQSRFFGGVNQ